MRLAVSNIAWSPEERIGAYRILAKAGITGLEIAPGLFFHAAKDRRKPSHAVARQALVEIEDAGLTLVSMQSLLFGVEGAALFEGAIPRRTFEDAMARAIELAGRFDIPNCVFGSPAQRRVPDGMPMDRALEEAAALFRRLGDRAVQSGTKIAIEANPARYGTNFLTTLDDAVQFVELVDHPAIVAILDLGAMHVNGSFGTVPERLPAIMPRLNHVHVSEPDLAPAPAPDTNLVPVLSTLQRAAYSKAVSIEMARPAAGLPALEAAVKRLVEAFVASSDCVEDTHA